ncbi:hypothetical protein J3A83DRAFT_4220187 [Scleroderma citrinum]
MTVNESFLISYLFLSYFIMFHDTYSMITQLLYRIAPFPDSVQGLPLSHLWFPLAGLIHIDFVTLSLLPPIKRLYYADSY